MRHRGIHRHDGTAVDVDQLQAQRRQLEQRAHQFVVVCRVALGLFALGHIFMGANHAQRQAVGAAAAQPAAAAHPAPLAVAMAQAAIEVVVIEFAGEMLGQLGPRRRQVIGVQQRSPGVDGGWLQIGWRVAQGLGQARVELELAGLHLPFPDHRTRALNRRLQALLLLRQGVFKLALRRDIDKARHRPARTVTPIERIGIDQQPAPLTRRQQYAQQEITHGLASALRHGGRLLVAPQGLAMPVLQLPARNRAVGPNQGVARQPQQTRRRRVAIDHLAVAVEHQHPGRAAVQDRTQVLSRQPGVQGHGSVHRQPVTRGRRGP